jgi:hypothetical protein
MPARLDAEPGAMRGTCQTRGAYAFRVEDATVPLTHEGLHVDATHAVNGPAEVRDRSRRFRRSFDRSGTRVIRFVVNR